MQKKNELTTREPESGEGHLREMQYDNDVK